MTAGSNNESAEGSEWPPGRPFSENIFISRSATVHHLAVVTDRLRRVIDRELAGRDYSVPQSRVLTALLNMPGSTDSKLRAYIGMEPSQLSKVRASLVEQGLIDVAPNPRHKSQVLMTLSEAGEAIARSIDIDRGAALSGEVDRLSPEDRQLIYNAVLGTHRDRAINAAKVTLQPIKVCHIGQMIVMAQRYSDEMKWDTGYIAGAVAMLAKFCEYADAKVNLGWFALAGGGCLEPLGYTISYRPQRMMWSYGPSCPCSM